MVNKLNKHSGQFLHKIKNAFAAGSLVTALMAGSPTSAQTIQNNNKITTTVNITTKNALTFATKNVDIYYPDMKNHLDSMINNFWDQEHKDTTIMLLNAMTKNITDPKQKVGSIIEALERSVFFEKGFAVKYDTTITDETFGYIETFALEYGSRFKRYYAKLLAETEKLKQEITKKQEYLKQKDEELKQKDEELKQSQEKLKQSQEELKQTLQELENTLSKFSSEDVKKNVSIKKLTLETETFYKEGGFPISTHLQSLFDATK